MAARDIEPMPPLSMLRRYLLARQWERVRLDVSELEIFRSFNPEAGTVEIVVPKSESVPDAEKRTTIAILSIAAFEGRDPSDLARSISGIGYDVIEAIIPSIHVFRDTVPLKLAEDLLRSTRRLIVTGAEIELSFSTRGSTAAAALDYIEKCRFGHTYRGSFGFQIESPVGRPPEDTVFDELTSIPLERRVVQRIARGLKTISVAANKLDPSFIIESSAFGFNANACADVRRIFEATSLTQIGFGFRLSPEWLPPDDVKDLSIRLDAERVIPILDSIVKSEPSEISERWHWISGRVVGLSSQNIPADLLNPEGREISVLWASEDFGDIRVRIRLSAKDYLVAYQAHLTGQHISIKGHLQRAGRGWRLEASEGISLV